MWTPDVYQKLAQQSCEAKDFGTARAMVAQHHTAKAQWVVLNGRWVRRNKLETYNASK